MFDNPKKELERLEQQLLAAETADLEDPAPDDEELYNEELYDEFDIDEAYDDELQGLFCDDVSADWQRRREEQSFSARSAGFDDADDYEMDTGRYVPAPKKKSLIGWLLVSLLELGLAAGLILWWLNHLGWLK